MIDVCDEIVDEFLGKMSGVEWRSKGIFFSEALAFIVYCKMYDVDMIIESGVRNGTSTEMWLNYFDEDFPIISIDENINIEDVSNTVERLSNFNNWSFYVGDGLILVPEMIEKNKENNIALLLDGPKGDSALHLSNDCFGITDNVKFSAIHDMGDGNYRFGYDVERMKSLSNYIFRSDDVVYRTKFSYVDDVLGGDDNSTFKEYKRRYPTGCGLAFLEHTLIDTNIDKGLSFVDSVRSENQEK